MTALADLFTEVAMAAAVRIGKDIANAPIVSPTVRTCRTAGISC